MFLEQQISLIERFLKDHATLKTGVMMLKIHIIYLKYIVLKENSSRCISHILYIKS